MASVEKSATSEGRINKFAQGEKEKVERNTSWKEIYTIAHFKAGDKTTPPKTLTILEDDSGNIYISTRDENGKIVLRLDDSEVASLMVILQARLLKKGMIR